MPEIDLEPREYRTHQAGRGWIDRKTLKRGAWVFAALTLVGLWVTYTTGHWIGPAGVAIAAFHLGVFLVGLKPEYFFRED